MESVYKNGDKMSGTQILFIFLIIAMSIAMVLLILELPNALERDRIKAEFCNEELHSYSFNRNFCDGKEYICNSKQCWWIK